MAPVFHLLPHAHLELRPLHGQSAQHELKWLLRSRDEQARPLWEVVLTTPVLRELLEALADGKASVASADLQLKVYADVALEASISSWATQQLDRHALLLARPATPLIRSTERVAVLNVQRL